MEQGQDLAGAGLIVGGAPGAVPLDSSLHRHKADLVFGIYRLVLHHRDGAVLGTNSDN